MIAYLKKLGFSYLTMDLEGFRSGSMDEKITQKEKQNESNFKCGPQMGSGISGTAAGKYSV